MALHHSFPAAVHWHDSLHVQQLLAQVTTRDFTIIRVQPVVGPDYFEWSPKTERGLDIDADLNDARLDAVQAKLGRFCDCADNEARGAYIDAEAEFLTVGDLYAMTLGHPFNLREYVAPVASETTVPPLAA